MKVSLKGCMNTSHIYHPGIMQREQAEKVMLSVSPEKGLTAYFFNCCLRVGLLISLHLEDDWVYPEPERACGRFPSHIPWLSPTAKPSLQLPLWKDLVHTSIASTFMAANQRNSSQIT